MKTIFKSRPGMNRGLRSALAFVFLVVVLDRSLGLVLEHLYKKTRSGEMGGLINGALSTRAQVLLLGSSRMQHHVDPEVLSRKLSLSVYNAGLDGEDFLYAAMLMDLWQRYDPPPRMIILQVDPFSFTKSTGELKRSSIFSFYLDESDLVRQVIYQQSALEPFKYVSSCYRANGKVLPIFKNLFAPDYDPLNGFRPLSGTMAAPPPGQNSGTPGLWEDPAEFWDFKVKCFKKLAMTCHRNGTRLFLFHSPRFAESRAHHDAWVAALKALLSDYPDVEFIDISEFTYPKVFANRPELYVDNVHLNAKGAEILSDLLASTIQARLRQSSMAAN
jgi:hypothetical protein